MKNRTLVTAALAATMLVGSFATASADHAVQLDVAPNPADSGDVVTVTATANGGISTGNPSVRIDICDTKDADVFTGVLQAAANCIAGVDGAEWRDLDSESAPEGEVTVLAVQFDTAGTDVDKVGFRARYTPQPDHAGATQTADLTILYAQTGDEHPGCNGIEVALEKGSAQGKANSAKALEKVAERFRCDF